MVTLDQFPKLGIGVLQSHRVVRGKRVTPWRNSPGVTLLAGFAEREFERGTRTVIRRDPQLSFVILDDGAANR